MERKRIAGVGIEREGGYGPAAYLGILLALCSWGGAIWSVVNRFLSPAILASQGGEVQHMYGLLTGLFSTALFQGGAAALLVLAGIRTTSVPNKIAFFVGAAAQAVLIVAFGLSYLPVSTYTVLSMDVFGRTLAGGMLTGMLLLMGANRENGDFGRYFCYLTAALTVAALAALGVYYVELWRALQQPYLTLGVRWQRASSVYWFLLLARDVLLGGTFLLLRETKPFLNYPHGDEENPFLAGEDLEDTTSLAGENLEDTADLSAAQMGELDELPQEHEEKS